MQEGTTSLLLDLLEGGQSIEVVSVAGERPGGIAWESPGKSQELDVEIGDR